MMENADYRKVRRGAPVLALLMSVFAACSGASGTQIAGQCDSSGSCAGMAGADGATTDRGGDGAAATGVGQDGPDSGSGIDDGGSLDATLASDAQSQGDAASESDPCPGLSLPPLWADCSGECPVLVADAGTCASGGSNLLCPSANPQQKVPSSDVIIRTPGQTVAACAQDCAPSGARSATAAVIFDLPNPATIEVGAPWYVVEAPLSPSCNLPMPVSGFCPGYVRGLWAVWTDVPNPPVRNIIIRYGACQNDP